MTARLCQIDLDDRNGPPPSEELRQERQVAIFDLLEANRFALPPPAPEGPYRLLLGVDGGRLAFDLSTQAGEPAGAFSLSLAGLTQIVKDYAAICASYYEAVKSQPPAQVEALDEARRAIHAEGARTLHALLKGKAETDVETARRLFTLVCASGPAG